MILIIGGHGQGKREYVHKNYNIPYEDMSKALTGHKVIYNLHDIIKSCILNDKNPKDIILNYADKNPNTIFICNEIGCGIVPIEPEERQWRESVGRICTELAKSAEQVERIFCGIPMKIK